MVAVAKDEVMVRDILSTAKKLFAIHGLKKTTMEDIANAMGKGKSTLYYYFPGKIEIFESVVEQELKSLLRVTQQTIDIATTAKDKLKVFLRTRVNAMAKFRNLSAVVYKDIFDHVAVNLKLKEKHDLIQLNLIKEIITEGVQSGEFKKLKDKDIELFSFTFVAAFLGVELPAFVSTLVKLRKNESDLLVDMLVDGIKG